MTRPARTHAFAAILATAMLAAVPAAAQIEGKGATAPPAPAAAGRAAPAAAPTADDRARPVLTVVGDDYRLQPGDKLRVEVYKDAQLSQSVQVRPDGRITLPLVGDLQAAGLKPLELRDRLTASLKEYVNNPVVTVIVVEGTVPTAFIVGEVNRPGMVTLQGRLTVLQALAMAGGLKDFADAKNIRILRPGQGGTETIPFNYRDAIKGNATSAVYLEPGDTVVVPD